MFPALLLRLPQPNSFKSFMLRRFISAAVSSIIFLILCAFILPWQAIVFPLSLTSLMYAGFLVLESLLLLDMWKEQWHHGGHPSFDSLKDVLGKSLIWMLSIGSNIMAGSYIVCLNPGGFSLCFLGFQLGYTVVFGSYASFLFIQTGHLTAPLVSHMFCNFMGLPVIYSQRTGLVSMAFIAGMVGFVWFLFPLTYPYLYNYGTENCECWH